MSSLSRGNASTIRLCLWRCSYHCYFGQLVILWFPLSTLCALYHSSWDLKISCSLQWKVLNLSSIFAIDFIHAVCIDRTLHLVDWEKERLNAALFCWNHHRRSSSPLPSLLSSSSKLCSIYVGVGYLNDMDWWDTSHGPADGPLSC